MLITWGENMEELTKSLHDDIRKRCESKNNFFGIGIYQHIKEVVKNAVFLAEKFGADKEIVEVAAWLHDVASITDYSLYKDHHIHGANMAEEILNKFNYPEEKIEKVKNCILNHRGSVLREKTSIEEICVSDADAISHFYSIPSLFHLAYVEKGYSIDEGKEFVKNKLQRSYNKMSDTSKKLYQDKYEKVMEVFK